MANPIKKIKRLEIPDEVQQANAMEELRSTIAKNKDAIVKGIHLLQTLHESGALDMIHALIIERETAFENVINELNKDRYTATIENVSNLFEYIGVINIEDLHYFTNKINEGMKEAKVLKDEENTTYVGLLRALKEPEINRSITMLLAFLRGMGRE